MKVDLTGRLIRIGDGKMYPRKVSAVSRKKRKKDEIVILGKILITRRRNESDTYR